MDNAVYAALTRQSGLLGELSVIANNVANAATTGYRAENVTFSEYVRALDGDAPSLSMAAARVRDTVLDQGGLAQTGGTFDVAIDGDGFFLIATPDGDRLTRNGAFTLGPVSELLTAQGHAVLDTGGAPVLVPPGAGPAAIAPDGTISVDGRPVAQIGLFLPADPADLIREDGVMFRSAGAVDPVAGRLLQGFLESSNADPVAEIARLIEVQRAYELGQGFLDCEDQRIRATIDTAGR